MGRLAGAALLVMVLAGGGIACPPVSGSGATPRDEAGAGGGGGFGGGGFGGGGFGGGGTGGAGGSGGAPPFCGDGRVDAGEDCDDGGTAPRDGCDANCRYECIVDADCDVDRGEACEPFDPYLPDRYGHCVVSDEFCNVDSNCGPPRCFPGECACVPSAAAAEAGFVGLCHRRVELCGACRSDAECGAGVVFDRPARCVTLPGDGGAPQSVCLPKDTGGCPAGFVAGAGELAGTCVPREGRCPEPECRIDAECPGGSICNQAERICVPAPCHFDFAAGVTVGCGPERPACHVGASDPRPLQTCDSAKAWGHGWCGPACGADADCAGKVDPRDGAAFVCRADGGVNRCRPAGCLDDAECVAPEGAHAGYCDAVVGACVYDACRLAPAPRHCGVLPGDCRGDTACHPDPSRPDGRGACLPPRP